MKNKLFLVALATVTVLGPSLATPHHQTVHAAEQAKEPQTSSMTCTNDGSVCAGWHSLSEGDSIKFIFKHQDFPVKLVMELNNKFVEFCKKLVHLRSL
ncbi:TPA: SpoV family signaling peptide [Streptococcus pyogenes]